MRFIIITILLIYPLFVIAQSASLKNAIELAHHGSFELAEQQFQRLNEQSASNQNEIRLQRAYNFSWWGKHDQAKFAFKKLLENDPDHIEVLVGMAYNESWAGHHTNAVQYFQKVLTLDHYNRSALVGLTYNYVKKGNPSAARNTLRQISSQFGEDAEYFYLSGLIASKEMNQARAKKFFKKAIDTDPQYQSARDKLNAYTTIPNKFNLTIWHGSAFTEKTVTHSLRRVDALYQMNERLLFIAGYDNSLSLLNSFLNLSGQNAPFAFVGSKYQFSRFWHAKIEIGRRFLLHLSDEDMINLENTFNLSKRLSLSTHLNYNASPISQLLTVGLTTEISFRDGLSIAASYYTTEQLNLKDHLQRRFVLTPKYSVHNFEIIAGLFYDQIRFESISKNQLAGYFGQLSFPIISRLDGRIFMQKDIGVFDNPIFLFSAGLSVKF